MFRTIEQLTNQKSVLPVNDVDGGRQRVVDTHKYGNRNTYGNISSQEKDLNCNHKPAKALDAATREVVKNRKPGRREMNAGLSMPTSLKFVLEQKVRSL